MRNALKLLNGAMLLSLLVSCQYRILEESGNTPENTALIPIKIDWSQSEMDVEEMHRASVWFFPQDAGGQIVEYRLEGNTTDAVIPIPLGVYSILIFNETIDESDWANISFLDCDRFDTFAACVREDTRDLPTRKGMRAEGTKYHLTAEPLAVWSLERFEVTKNMVDVTRSRSIQGTTRAYDYITRAQEEAVDTQLHRLLTITPQPIVVKAHVKGNIINLNSANAILGQVKGFTYGIVLATGKQLQERVNHVFNMNNRTWIDPIQKKDGTVEADFYLFKFPNGSDVQYGMEMNIKLMDNTWMEPELFDITHKVDSEKFTVTIEVGKTSTDTPEDRPIVLPEVITNPDVGISDWVDTEIGIE